MKKQDFTIPQMTVSDLSKALFESNQKLRNVIEERNKLFSNISHDLRAPITAIHNAINAGAGEIFLTSIESRPLNVVITPNL